MSEPIPIQPKPEPGWEAAEASKLVKQGQRGHHLAPPRTGHSPCWWHGDKPGCKDIKVREPNGDPICWDGWVALLHATGTCSGECNYDHEPSESEPDRATRKRLVPCRQDR